MSRRASLTTLDSTKQVLNFCRFLNWKILMKQQQRLPNAYQDLQDNRYGLRKVWLLCSLLSAFRARSWSNLILLKIWIYSILQRKTCKFLAFRSDEVEASLLLGRALGGLNQTVCLDVSGTRQPVRRCHIPESMILQLEICLRLISQSRQFK